MIKARFTAESACYGGAPEEWCSVRVLVDGSEAQPADGDDFAFDSTDAGTETDESWESHSVERYVLGAGAGTHTVTVQALTTDAATTLRLDDWTLVVEAIRA